jgi:hypothetical protein
MTAPDQLPRHGGADQAGPTEKENTQRSPFLWKPAHRRLRLFARATLASDEYCGAAA